MTLLFTNSCAPINLPCSIGEQIIDPCSCRKWLQCETSGYDFLSRNCGQGTAWNHQTKTCDSENKIFIANGIPICEKEKPWSRCSSVEDNYKLTRLKKLCEGGDDTSPPVSSSGDGGDDVGAIVGGILGGLAVIVIIVVIIILWRRKKQQDKDGSNGRNNFNFRPTLPARRKKPEVEEEVYDVIGAKNSETTPVSNPGYDKQEEQTEYDNPSFSQLDERDYSHLEGPAATSGDNNRNMYTNEPGGNYQLSRTEDLSRSIHIEGKDVLVQDQEGYAVGYPSGSVTPQPSPLLPPARHHQRDLDGVDDVTDDGYKFPKNAFPPDYMELELEQDRTSY